MTDYWKKPKTNCDECLRRKHKAVVNAQTVTVGKCDPAPWGFRQLPCPDFKQRSVEYVSDETYNNETYNNETCNKAGMEKKE